MSIEIVNWLLSSEIYADKRDALRRMGYPEPNIIELLNRGYVAMTIAGQLDYSQDDQFMLFYNLLPTASHRPKDEIEALVRSFSTIARDFACNAIEEHLLKPRTGRNVLPMVTFWVLHCSKPSGGVLLPRECEDQIAKLPSTMWGADIIKKRLTRSWELAKMCGEILAEQCQKRDHDHFAEWLNDFLE